ncbi:MAG: hypothetical protein KJS64_08085, partial [Acidobacteria bacterium]|nr:hypothetical protein [Acidobacteriota bacterium]
EGHRELVHNVFAAMGLQAMLADFAKDWWTELDQYSSSTVITNSALERALLHCVICGVGLTEDETLRDSLMCIFCDWEHKLRNEFRENAFGLERAKAEIASEEYRRGFDL